MTDPILSAKNNAESQLFAGITAASMTFVVTGGEGSKFSTGYNANTTSAGTASILNATGIQAALSALGITSVDNLWIRNITDGSQTNVIAINTDSLTTMDLKSGSDNTWDNGDEFDIGTDVITLNTRDVDGNITAFENVRIKYIDNSADTFYIENRGHAGTTPVAWGTGSYVSAFMNQSHLRGLQEQISIINKDKAEDSKVIHTTGDETKDGILTFNDLPRQAIYSDPTLDNELVTMKWVSDNFVVGSSGAIVNYPAGETASANKGWYIDAPIFFANTSSSSDNSRIGYSASFEKVSFKIIGTGVSDNSIDLGLSKFGTPSDNLIIRIETDSAGEPSGILADVNATSSIIGGSVTTTPTDTTVNFAGSFTLTDETVYHCVLERSGSLNPTNYFAISIKSLEPGYFEEKQLVSSVWTVRTNNSVYWSNFLGAYENIAMLTDGTSDFAKEAKLLGLSSDAPTEGGIIAIDTRDIPGIVLSSLVPGDDLFLGSAGNIVQTESPFIIGIAISDTTIKRKEYFNLYRELLTDQEGTISGHSEQSTTSVSYISTSGYTNQESLTLPGLDLFTASGSSITFDRDGVYDISFECDGKSGNPTFFMRASLLKNGSLIGTVDSTNSATYVTLNASDSNISFVEGDVLTLGFSTSNGSTSAFIKNGIFSATLVKLIR